MFEALIRKCIIISRPPYPVPIIRSIEREASHLQLSLRHPQELLPVPENLHWHVMHRIPPSLVAAPLPSHRLPNVVEGILHGTVHLSATAVDNADI